MRRGGWEGTECYQGAIREGTKCYQGAIRVLR